MTNYMETRDCILHGFVEFIQTDIPDATPQLVDNALRMLHSLMCHWRSTILGMQHTKVRSAASETRSPSLFDVWLMHKIQQYHEETLQ